MCCSSTKSKNYIVKLGTNLVEFSHIHFLVLCSELCFGPSLEKVLLFDIALFALFYMKFSHLLD